MLEPRTIIGHVHLKVSDLERSIKFYEEIIGFDLVTRWGPAAAFLSAGGYHHHLGLNTWESKDGQPPPERTTGLFHFAILMPDRRSLAEAYKRLLKNNWPLDGAADHGVSEALYLRDPDSIGVELYRDRPKTDWPRDPEGNIIMYTRPLDLEALLREADKS